MLSYQHAYHAGGLVDVHKHSALSRILYRLSRSSRTCTYIETHAGRGLYDLNSAEARKTGEAQRGILALLKSEGKPAKQGPLPAPYLHAIKAARAVHGPTAYPGSPIIAQILLRPSDPLHLMELHPQEFAALSRAVNGRGIHVTREDGFAAAARLVPPVHDGLVFVDPSYDVKTDYDAAADFVERLRAAWPGFRLLLWYPILDAGLHHKMVTRLEDAALPGYERDDVYFPEQISPRLRGSGLIGVNLPEALAL